MYNEKELVKNVGGDVYQAVRTVDSDQSYFLDEGRINYDDVKI